MPAGGPRQRSGSREPQRPSFLRASRPSEKLGAKQSLEEALAIFEPRGAVLWAAKTRAELGRLGRRPGPRSELTRTEKRVALVASGLTNLEVASELFMNVKAVEAHLSRVYPKLGARARTVIPSTCGSGAQPPTKHQGRPAHRGTSVRPKEGGAV